MGIPAECFITYAESMNCKYYNLHQTDINSIQMLETADHIKENTLYIAARTPSIPADSKLPVILTEPELLISVFQKLQEILIQDYRILAEISGLYRNISDISMAEAVRLLSSIINCPILILNHECNVVEKGAWDDFIVPSAPVLRRYLCPKQIPSATSLRNDSLFPCPYIASPIWEDLSKNPQLVGFPLKRLL